MGYTAVRAFRWATENMPMWVATAGQLVAHQSCHFLGGQLKVAPYKVCPNPGGTALHFFLVGMCCADFEK